MGLSPRNTLLVIARNIAKGVISESTDQCCHRVLRSHTDELHSVLPSHAVFEKCTRPFDELALACSWQALDHSPHGFSTSCHVDPARVNFELL